MTRAAAILAAAALLTACDRAEAPAPDGPASPRPPAATAPSRPPVPTPVESPPPAPPPVQAEAEEIGTDDWSRLAASDDRDRLARLPAAWELALVEARKAHDREVERLGAVADPNAGLPRPHPGPGLYRCRTIKLGDMQPGPHSLGYAAYPWFRCRIELTPGGDLLLAKQTGSQRVTGQLYPERDSLGRDTRRLVFLGAQAWGSDEASAPAYGDDPERDQIGVLERIGPDRYRLALPWPRQESKLDLLELERVGA